MTGAVEVVRSGLNESADLHRRVATDRADVVVHAADVMLSALAAGRQVLVFGNGGSATDAQHFAAELVGRFERDRRPVGVIALTTDTAILTSVGNDYGYEAIFARQVEALGHKGDVAMGISTSGASKNVNTALVLAKAKGLVTIGLTGKDGGETGRLVDVHVNVPGRTTARTQEVHRTLLHLMCQLIEVSL
jgi:D-sedoheptulose 7-phosphate isomerase